MTSKQVVAVLLACAIAASAQAGIKESVALHLAIAAPDLAVTEYGVGNGWIVERGSFGGVAPQTTFGRTALTVSAAAFAGWIDNKLQRNKPALWAFRVGHVALRGYAVMHNMALINRVRVF
jgi:hypothetical protein